MWLRHLRYAKYIYMNTLAGTNYRSERISVIARSHTFYVYFYTKTRKQTPKRPETLKLAMVSMPGKTDNSIGSRGLVNSDLAPQRLRHMHNMMQQAAPMLGLGN